jgi:hypothetical protein
MGMWERESKEGKQVDRRTTKKKGKKKSQAIAEQQACGPLCMGYRYRTNKKKKKR